MALFDLLRATPLFSGLEDEVRDTGAARRLAPSVERRLGLKSPGWYPENPLQAGSRLRVCASAREDCHEREPATIPFTRGAIPSAT